ncbi:MAG TPA: NAD-dependent epimerase/dehydratase family protein [Mariprofundaceae bacterium]|nr:NAD-dependent epimerase/dehydratase family protein [Mariprofundaceae bacterium]
MAADELNVVLGAGPVGRALISLLHGRGVPLRVVTRSGSADVPEGVEVVAADLSRADEAVRACAGASIVYSCVGIGYREWPERWPPLMAGMLAGAEAAGARFIFADNLYMYGPREGLLTEALPLTDYGRKPATRAHITRMWQVAHAEGRVQAAAVRASDFYGPSVRKAVLGNATFARIVQGMGALCLGDVDQPHSFTYVPDIARALVTIGEADETAWGRAWHVPNAPDRTVREILTMFAEASGQELKISALPRWLHAIVGLFDEDMRELKEMRYQWEWPFCVDASAFTDAFDMEVTPFDEGIAQTLAWYRERLRQRKEAQK